MKRLITLCLAVALFVGTASAATFDTRGQLCPACKVIIDYGAVGSAASGVGVACQTLRCKAAAANLEKISKSACDAEVRALDTAKINQAQFDRMDKLWKASCDRAVLMNDWRRRLLAGAGRDEAAMASTMDSWADEMQCVPREVSQGKVPDCRPK